MKSSRAAHATRGKYSDIHCAASKSVIQRHPSKSHADTCTRWSVDLASPLVRTAVSAALHIHKTKQYHVKNRVPTTVSLSLSSFEPGRPAGSRFSAVTSIFFSCPRVGADDGENNLPRPFFLLYLACFLSAAVSRVGLQCEHETMFLFGKECASVYLLFFFPLNPECQPDTNAPHRSQHG